MRQNQNVQVGQVWRSSDPRRLRAFRVLFADMRSGCARVDVEILYPPLPFPRNIQQVNPAGFLTTGTKGLVRVS